MKDMNIILVVEPNKDHWNVIRQACDALNVDVMLIENVSAYHNAFSNKLHKDRPVIHAAVFNLDVPYGSSYWSSATLGNGLLCYFAFKRNYKFKYAALYCEQDHHEEFTETFNGITGNAGIWMRDCMRHTLDTWKKFLGHVLVRCDKHLEPTELLVCKAFNAGLKHAYEDYGLDGSVADNDTTWLDWWKEEKS